MSRRAIGPREWPICRALRHHVGHRHRLRRQVSLPFPPPYYTSPPLRFSPYMDLLTPSPLSLTSTFRNLAGSYDQALFAGLVPSGKEAELSGLFVFSNSALEWLPPLLFSLCNQWVGSLRWALASLVGFYLAAIALLATVHTNRPMNQEEIDAVEVGPSFMHVPESRVFKEQRSVPYIHPSLRMHILLYAALRPCVRLSSMCVDAVAVAHAAPAAAHGAEPARRHWQRPAILCLGEFCAQRQPHAGLEPLGPPIVDAWDVDPCGYGWAAGGGSRLPRCAESYRRVARSDAGDTGGQREGAGDTTGHGCRGGGEGERGGVEGRGIG